MMEFRPIAALRRLSAALVAGGVQGPVWRGGAGDMVATLYDDGVFQAVSPSAKTMIGAAGKLVGRSLFDFVAREDRPAVRAVFDHAAERGMYADPARLRAEFTLLRVRRAGAPAEITVRPTGDGRLSALIRERVRPSHTREPVAVAKADAAPAPDADLMADLAHELKTPLNAIMGFADVMRAETYGPLGGDDRSAEKYGEYANLIHASGAHLTALIGAAQNYAQHAAGRYRIERAPTDPGAVAAECAEMLRSAADAAGLALHVEIAPELPAAMLDARAVRQILINLLSNAIKFTEAGEVVLSVALENGRLVFAVRDTGVGMNKMTLAKLGGRWSDTHRRGVRGAGGSGLGLSLAFDLARLHGGALDIESAPGEGTLARFTTPLGEKAPSGFGGAGGASSSDVQSQLDRVNAFRAERSREGRAA